MPSTTELLNLLELSSPNWNREGERSLINMLNQAQDLLMLQEMDQTQAYRSDGSLPYIATDGSTTQYTLNQATTGLSVDIWRVSAVLLKTSAIGDVSDLYTSNYEYVSGYKRPTQPYYYNGIEYFRFLQVATVDAKRGGHPTLKFTLVPSSSTSDLRLICYEKPTQIQIETTQPTVPESLHLSHLLPTAMKLIEAYSTGNWLESMQYINKEFMRDFQEQMCGGEQGDEHSITRIEE